jgi:hypothetical protein
LRFSSVQKHRHNGVIITCIASGVQGGRGVKDSEDGVNFTVVDEGIRSPMFWAYLNMMEFVRQCLSAISDWSESCPCHGADPALHGKNKDKLSGLVHRIGFSECPMAGRRAPEAAAGAIKDFVADLLRKANADLILDPRTLRCDAEEQQRLQGASAL